VVGLGWSTIRCADQRSRHSSDSTSQCPLCEVGAILVISELGLEHDALIPTRHASCRGRRFSDGDSPA